MVVQPVDWIAQYAARKGLRYEPDPDERWLRAWEPYATLKVPIRYEHALHATGTIGSLSIARMVLPTDRVAGVPRTQDVAAWIAIGQDVRLEGTAAATCDAGRIFAESLDLVSMPRKSTGDTAFDHIFATFSPSRVELARAITPSLRKLVLSWRIPLHFEIRKGGFILAPVALGADPRSLGWFVRATELFCEKAVKPSR